MRKLIQIIFIISTAYFVSCNDSKDEAKEASTETAVVNPDSLSTLKQLQKRAQDSIQMHVRINDSLNIASAILTDRIHEIDSTILANSVPANKRYLNETKTKLFACQEYIRLKKNTLASVALTNQINLLKPAILRLKQNCEKLDELEGKLDQLVNALQIVDNLIMTAFGLGFIKAPAATPPVVPN